MKVLPICPSHLSDVTTLLWEIQKVIFNSVIPAYFWLFTLFQKKTNCNPLAHPIWNCHHTNLWIAKLFHPDWRFAAYFQTLEALKRASCGLSSVVMWLATEMLGKQCHSNCSEWPPSALIHASGLFRHWSGAQYTTLCWNSAHVATSRCRKPQYVHINTRAPPVACPRRSTRAMQIIGSTKQQ